MTARSSATQGQPAINTGELSSERLRRTPRDCQLLAAGSTMNTNTQQYERYKHTKQDATKTRRNLYQNAHWFTCFAHFNFLRHCLAQTLSRWCAGFQCRLPCCRTAWPGLFSDSRFFWYLQISDYSLMMHACARICQWSFNWFQLTFNWFSIDFDLLLIEIP